MNILGINFLSEASVALIQDGKIVNAASEERFNREKLWHGYPENAVGWALENAGLKITDIDIIATTGKAPKEPPKEPYLEKEEQILKSSLPIPIKKGQQELLWKRYKREKMVLGKRTPDNINFLKKLGPKVVAIDHHLAHAASAYFTSGWKNAVILTIDGWGENSSNLLAVGKDGEIETLNYSNTFDSLGYYYGSVTKFLGFKPHRHEGKVLGLAAFGDNSVTEPIMRKMIGFDKEKQRFLGKMEEGIFVPSFNNPNLQNIMKIGEKSIISENIYSKADISAGLQKVLEETVMEYVNNLSYKKMKLCLAGGVFANVKLNQRLLELPQVENVYIYPNMGDGGLAAGSALYVYSQEAGLKPFQTDNVYYGPEFTEEEIKESIRKNNLKAVKYDNISEEIAELLVKGKVVARFNGKMEWGPRALGNRSILYQPTDDTVNDWLNKKLQRTEFMPFAPVSIKENALKCYKGYKEDHIAADFMTITYDCTDDMKQTQPAVVHVDGTARPQIITKKVNPSYYDIVETYYKLTGVPSLINTSFNMHEEPIVCSPSDAIRSFRQGHLDYLAIGDFLIKNSGE